MREVLVVKGREALTVVDGLAYYEHSSEREVIVVNDLRQVFQHTAIDVLVGPGEMVAG